MRIIAALLVCISASSALALNAELEQAARLGTALMICDLNKHGVGSMGWNDLIARGADREHVSSEAATEFVNARQREIISYLNRAKKLDEFCANVADGEL